MPQSFCIVKITKITFDYFTLLGCIILKWGLDVLESLPKHRKQDPSSAKHGKPKKHSKPKKKSPFFGQKSR